MKKLALDFSKLKIPVTNEGVPFDVNSTDLKLGQIITAVIPYIFGATGIALLIYLIIGGFQIMFSRGDPKAMQSAQSKITNALIGFVIVFLAYLIVRLLGQLFGIQNSSFGNPFRQ